MDNILEALNYIDVSSLSYQEWINVGMALKSEGFSCDVWDSWSRNDSRYKAGECERKWKTFTGVSNPIKGGTIIQMAKDNGFDGLTYIYQSASSSFDNSWNRSLFDYGVEMNPGYVGMFFDKKSMI